MKICYEGTTYDLKKTTDNRIEITSYGKHVAIVNNLTEATKYIESRDPRNCPKERLF